MLPAAVRAEGSRREGAGQGGAGRVPAGGPRAGLPDRCILGGGERQEAGGGRGGAPRLFHGSCLGNRMFQQGMQELLFVLKIPAPSLKIFVWTGQAVNDAEAACQAAAAVEEAAAAARVARRQRASSPPAPKVCKHAPLVTAAACMPLLSV